MSNESSESDGISSTEDIELKEFSRSSDYSNLGSSADNTASSRWSIEQSGTGENKADDVAITFLNTSDEKHHEFDLGQSSFSSFEGISPDLTRRYYSNLETSFSILKASSLEESSIRRVYSPDLKERHSNRRDLSLIPQEGPSTRRVSPLESMEGSYARRSLSLNLLEGSSIRRISSLDSLDESSARKVSSLDSFKGPSIRRVSSLNRLGEPPISTSAKRILNRLECPSARRVSSLNPLEGPSTRRVSSLESLGPSTRRVFSPNPLEGPFARKGLSLNFLDRPSSRRISSRDFLEGSSTRNVSSLESLKGPSIRKLSSLNLSEETPIRTSAKRISTQNRLVDYLTRRVSSLDPLEGPSTRRVSSLDPPEVPLTRRVSSLDPLEGPSTRRFSSLYLLEGPSTRRFSSLDLLKGPSSRTVWFTDSANSSSTSIRQSHSSEIEMNELFYSESPTEQNGCWFRMLAWLSSLLKCFARKIRLSRYYPLFLVALFAISCSSGYMGSRYNYLCGGCPQLPLLVYLLGLLGVCILTILIANVISERYFDPYLTGRELQNLMISILVPFFLFLIIEVYTTYACEPVFIFPHENFCIKVFYNYAYYMNVAMLLLIPLLMLIHIPNFSDIEE